jgi:hypothetical protein
MCWNSEVSLNTFVFSMFVLLLLMYNNAYTKYKIPILNHFWVYVFFISFISIQLIEYFIWRNLHNPFYNKVFSICAELLILFQPITTIMLINNDNLKKYMLILYLILTMPFAIYRFSVKKIVSSVTKKGHLYWDNILYKNYSENIYFVIWLFFFLFSFFYNQSYFELLFGLIMLIIISYNFISDGSMGTMWCWIVNSIMLYYAAYLLIYLPFTQK